MTELFTLEIEHFIENTYDTDAVVFQEIILEESNRRLISLCYYWNPSTESDMYELVHAAKNENDGEIYCETIGRFPQNSPKIEEIASTIQRMLWTYM